jgi:hypothetical protein
MRPFVVLGMLLLFALAQRTAAQRHRDPCRLLTDAEVRAVQGHAPAQKIPSEQPAGSFRFTQCFYRTPELSSSVSVALGIPLTDSKRSGPRDYWQAQFKREERDEREESDEKKHEPRRLAGLGDEAFWVGDPCYRCALRFKRRGLPSSECWWFRRPSTEDQTRQDACHLRLEASRHSGPTARSR